MEEVSQDCGRPYRWGNNNHRGFAFGSGFGFNDDIGRFKRNGTVKATPGKGGYAAVSGTPANVCPTRLCHLPLGHYLAFLC